MLNAWRTAERRPSNPHEVVGSPPQTTSRTARRAGPARALEADDRSRGGLPDPVGGAVVLARVGVVEGGARDPPGADRVQRRVLAEVLHPAVIAVLDRLAGHRGEGLPAGRAAKVELGDVERGGGRVVEKVGLARAVLDQPAAGGRRFEDGVIAGADHRVEVGGDGQAPPVHGSGSLPLAVSSADLRPARQVMGVGLCHRERGVRLLQPIDQLALLLGGPGRLHPRPEQPRRRGRGLAPGVAGEAPQRVGGGRTGEEPQLEVGRRRYRGRLIGRCSGHLDAPGTGPIEVEVGGSRARGQDAVAGAREQPRDRVVGRVRTRAEPPLRDHRLHQRILARLVGAVGDVALDLLPALVDRVGSLAEAEIALIRPRLEAHAECLDRRSGAVDPPVQGDHPCSAGPDADLHRAPARVCGPQLGDVGAPLPPAGDQPGGALPFSGAPEADRPRSPATARAVAGEDHPPPAIHQTQAPGRARDPGLEGPGVGDRGGAGGRSFCRECDQHYQGRDADPKASDAPCETLQSETDPIRARQACDIECGQDARLEAGSARAGPARRA